MTEVLITAKKSEWSLKQLQKEWSKHLTETEQVENIYLFWKIIQKCSHHLQVEDTIHYVSAFMEPNVLYIRFQPDMLF